MPPDQPVPPVQPGGAEPVRIGEPVRIDGLWLMSDPRTPPGSPPSISLVGETRGLTILGPDPGASVLVPWSSVRSVAGGPLVPLPDGSPAATVDIVLTDRWYRFVAAPGRLAPDAVARLQAVAAAAPGGPAGSGGPPGLTGPGEAPGTWPWAPWSATVPTPAAPLPGPPQTNLASVPGPWPPAAPASPPAGTGPAGAYAAGPVAPAPPGTIPPASVPGATPWPAGGAPGRQSRARRWWVPVAAGVAAAIVLAGVGIGVWLGTSSSSPSGTGSGDVAQANRLVRQALAAAHAAGSFHYASTTTGAGGVQTVTGDAGPTQGRQLFDENGSQFVVLVVGETGYFQGDAASAQSVLDLPAPLANAHAGQWIAVSPGDQPYAALVEAVTTSSALSDSITIQPRQVLPASSFRGRKVVTVTGTPTVPSSAGSSGSGGSFAPGSTASLVIDARTHLPVRFVVRGMVLGQLGSVATTSVTDFSNWGAPVHVSAPAGAVPYSSLGITGGSPSSTTGPTAAA